MQIEIQRLLHGWGEGAVAAGIVEWAQSLRDLSFIRTIYWNRIW